MRAAAAPARAAARAAGAARAASGGRPRRARRAGPRGAATFEAVEAACDGDEACLEAALLQLEELGQLEEPAPAAQSIDTRTVVGVVLGGGAGTRLYPLTRQRAKPAVPVGGSYRLIDVPLSNCLNSGIGRVYVLTQFNSASLNRHVSRTYGGEFASFGSEGFVEVLAATMTAAENSGGDWFRGTADAVRQYLWLFSDPKNKGCEDVMILSGDHLYRMDYTQFIAAHRQKGADVTVACLPVDKSRASDFGLMRIDDEGRVCEFAEKPKGDALAAMEVDTTVLGLSREEAERTPYIASMGIYVFRKSVLIDLLAESLPCAMDFGSEVIPQAKDGYHIQAFLFTGYWEDIGTMRSFYDANLALTDSPPDFAFYDAAAPIYTSPRFLPPSNIFNSEVCDSIVSHGSDLNSCRVRHSLVGLRSRIAEGALLQDTLMMGADYYETEAEQAALHMAGQIPMGIGANTVVKGCIIDKNARIGANCRITNAQGIVEARREEHGYCIRDGILTVLRNGTIADNTII